MKRLEDELRNALRRRQAPQGLAERVISRIGVQAPRGGSRWGKYASFFHLPKMVWCVVAVVTCLAVFLGIAQYRSYQKTRTEGELAKSQLMLALKITGQKLSFVQRKVLEIHNRGVPSERRENR
jgi:hypothetical protein